VELAPDVEVGANAVILAHDEGDGPPTVVQRGAIVGANATILPGVTLGLEARIQPGAVATRSVPPRAIAEGNPARIVGYVDAGSGSTPAVEGPHPPAAPVASRVRGVALHRLRTASDIRGTLAAAEVGEHVPFQPARCFIVHGVPSAETRGEHAHRTCHQFLIAVSGSVRVVVDDGEAREEFVLDSPSVGLFLPATTWGIQYGHTPGTVVVVLASEHYDAEDYVRDYEEFLRLVHRTRTTAMPDYPATDERR
jgi:hypothetical protein